MASGQAVLLSTKAKVINALVDHDGSVEDVVLSTEPDQVILNPDEGDHLVTGHHIAQVSHVSLLGSRSSVVQTERVVVTSCSFAVVGEVSILVDVEAVLARAEIHQFPRNPKFLVYISFLLNNVLLYLSPVWSLMLHQEDVSGDLTRAISVEGADSLQGRGGGGEGQEES